MSSTFHEIYISARPFSDALMLAFAAGIWYGVIELFDDIDSPALGIICALTALAALSATMYPFTNHNNRHPFGKKDIPEAAE